MGRWLVLACLILGSGSIGAEGVRPTVYSEITEFQEIPNPMIDYDTFLEQAARVGEIRQHRRVTEKQFISMAKDRSTVVLDARSAMGFQQLHVKGAVNLSLPDFTADRLAKVIPSKDTRILIYCNNNFLNDTRAMGLKAPPASLNVHTHTTLYAYGYTNVYELGPLLDMKKSKLEFEGTDVAWFMAEAERLSSAPTLN